MKLNIKITEDDFREFADFAFSKLQSEKINHFMVAVRLAILWVLVVGMLFFIIRYDPNYTDTFTFHLPSMLFIIVPVIILVIGHVVSIKKTRKFAVPYKDGLTIGEKEIELTDEGIRETSIYGNSFLYWNAIDSVLTHNDKIYIVCDTTNAFIIPDGSFEGNKRKQSVINYINEKIHNKHSQQDGAKDSPPLL